MLFVQMYQFVPIVLVRLDEVGQYELGVTVAFELIDVLVAYELVEFQLVATRCVLLRAVVTVLVSIESEVWFVVS